MSQRSSKPRRSRPRRQPVQLELRQRSWGGRRDGAGRKPGAVRPTAHRSRPALASRFPVHVTLRVDEALPDLRDEVLSEQLQQAVREGKERDGFRLVHYCILTHHLHLIVEAPDAQRLTEGIRGLCVRLARCINRFAGRTGRVFVDRYYARILRTPREVRNSIAYVILNCRRHAAQHGRKLRPDWVDDCSSGRFFDGWRDRPPGAPSDEQPTVAAPGTWLLQQGWRRWGRIRIDEVPG
jgi:REP element-mobilizing transposase RayT